MKTLVATIRGMYCRLRYRLLNKNVAIGKAFRVYGRLEIKGKGKIQIGDNCVISGIPGDRGQLVALYTHNAQAAIVIGDNVRLYGAKLGCSYEIVVGNEVLIEESSILDTDFHSLDKDRHAVIGEAKEVCRVNIGNGVRIGARSIVMRGVAIGDDATVGPGSIVNRSLPSGCLALGNPVKVIVKSNN